MPKPLKKPRKRPSDPNQWARQLVDESTSEAETEVMVPAPPKGLSAYMSALGRKGGRIGGKRRLETMTSEERSRIALQAARSRWKKVKATKTKDG